MQLTGHTNERTFYKYVKAPPRTDCQAIGFQLYRIAIQAGISRDEIGDGFEDFVQGRGFVDNQRFTSTNPLTY